MARIPPSCLVPGQVLYGHQSPHSREACEILWQKGKSRLS